MAKKALQLDPPLSFNTRVMKNLNAKKMEIDKKATDMVVDAIFQEISILPEDAREKFLADRIFRAQQQLGR